MKTHARSWNTVFSEAIYRCDMVANISFTTALVAKSIQNFQTIHAILYTADPMFSSLIHKVVIEELMELPCVRLEVGAA